MLRVKYKFLSEICYRDYVSKIKISSDQNLKHFWKFILERKYNNGIPAEVYLVGTSASDAYFIFHHFFDYFAYFSCVCSRL